MLHRARGGKTKRERRTGAHSRALWDAYFINRARHRIRHAGTALFALAHFHLPFQFVGS